LRIVAGKWRGRPIRAPRGKAVRPTADRVREALFSALAGRTSGRSVLDLFAGTGALGLEALSRGAVRAVFVEVDPEAFAVLRRNLEALEATEAEALLMDYRRAVRTLRERGRRFGLVFLDPPYGKGMAEDAAARLREAGLLEPGAAVVVEEAARTPEAVFPDPWNRVFDRRYGDTRVTVFELPGASCCGQESREEMT
jgi:16S rRNA (guanine966-N2)-methyltransferase